MADWPVHVHFYLPVHWLSATDADSYPSISLREVKPGVKGWLVLRAQAACTDTLRGALVSCDQECDKEMPQHLKELLLDSTENVRFIGVDGQQLLHGSIIGSCIPDLLPYAALHTDDAEVEVYVRATDKGKCILDGKKLTVKTSVQWPAQSRWQAALECRQRADTSGETYAESVNWLIHHVFADPDLFGLLLHEADAAGAVWLALAATCKFFHRCHMALCSATVPALRGWEHHPLTPDQVTFLTETLPFKLPGELPSHDAFRDVPVGYGEYQILLSETEWLNDEIMTAYCHLLEDCCYKNCKSVWSVGANNEPCATGAPGVILAMGPGFYHRMSGSYSQSAFYGATRNVRRASAGLRQRNREAGGEMNSLPIWKIGFPINVNQIHWVGVVIVFNAELKIVQINGNDSMQIPFDTDLIGGRVKDWIVWVIANQDNYTIFENLMPIDMTWTVVIVDRGWAAPRQVGDSNNCGVFTLRWLDCFLMERAYDYCVSEMMRERHQMCLQLYHGSMGDVPQPLVHRPWVAGKWKLITWRDQRQLPPPVPLLMESSPLKPHGEHVVPPPVPRAQRLSTGVLPTLATYDPDGRSPVHVQQGRYGWEVVLMQSVNKNQHLTSYDGSWVADDEEAANCWPQTHLNATGPRIIDGLRTPMQGRGMASFINHAAESGANVCFTVVGDQVVACAKDNLAVGTILVANYGTGYDVAMGLARYVWVRNGSLGSRERRPVLGWYWGDGEHPNHTIRVAGRRDLEPLTAVTELVHDSELVVINPLVRSSLQGMPCVLHSLPCSDLDMPRAGRGRGMTASTEPWQYACTSQSRQISWPLLKVGGPWGSKSSLLEGLAVRLLKT